MKYNKVTFISGIEGEGYQEILDGEMQRLTDLDGNTINPLQDMSYSIIEANADVPSWGIS